MCLFVLLLIPNLRAMQPQEKRVDIRKMSLEVKAENIETSIRKLVSFGTRNTYSSQEDKTRGIGAARDWIFDEFQKISSNCNGCLIVEKQSYWQENKTSNPKIPKSTNISNVFATLKGTVNPERFYVVSGHYDSRCSDVDDAACDAPGANDDASGTAAVIELARVMSTRKFDATIVFMAVAGEEQGLLGAKYFAEQAHLKKMDIEGMLTNDIIGGVTTMRDSQNRNSVRVFSEGVPSDETVSDALIRRSVGGENDSPSRQLARYMKEQTKTYIDGFDVWMIYRRDRYLRGGDHIPFLEKGYASVRLTEPNEDYDHQHQNVRMENAIQYGDLIQFVDFEYVAKVAQVNLVALASLSLAPSKPKDVKIMTKQLTNHTELKWNANLESDLAGYEVVWRDTTSPIWTDSVFAGNVTAFKVKKMSKDNYFFGVRAVDKDGNKSPVVSAKPSK